MRQHQLDPDVPSEDWDRALAQLGGHPWQSALWGNARRNVDHVIDHRWLVRRGDDIVQMIRLEERRIPGIGRVAWVPRGPTTAGGDAAPFEFEPAIIDGLGQRGFVAAVANPWRRNPLQTRDALPPVTAPRTIWIDLRVGQDQLWHNLERQYRYGVGRAQREGVVVEDTRDPARVTEFFGLCGQISRTKGFQLRTSERLMSHLLEARDQHVGAHLFAARYKGRMAAGAFVLRCGKSIHYLWGASDRTFSRQRAAEAVHWGIMQWAVKLGCARYDLEGIDPEGNAGTYAFKKKMGGEEVPLVNRRVHGIGMRGRILAPALTLALNNSWLADLPALFRLYWPHDPAALKALGRG
jgi:hypothetical protein